MKKRNKTIILIISIVVLYCTIILVDISRVNQLKKPIFCIENGYMGSMTRFDGLGYKIGLDINATTGEITYGQMTMLGQTVVKLYRDDEHITLENVNDEIESKFETTEIDGISMFIKEGTLTNKGATIIIKDINGKGKYVYGTSFRIDKKVNDKWVKPKTTDNNCAFTSMAYYVDDNGYLEFNQNWNCMYSSLEKGTYRLVKYTFLESDIPITEDEHKYFSVEFVIE